MSLVSTPSIHTHRQAGTHAHSHAHVHLSIHARTHARTHTHTQAHLHSHARTHARTHTRTRTRTRTRARTTHHAPRTTHHAHAHAHTTNNSRTFFCGGCGGCNCPVCRRGRSSQRGSLTRGLSFRIHTQRRVPWRRLRGTAKESERQMGGGGGKGGRHLSVCCVESSL
jgi:hypothetical protein